MGKERQYDERQLCEIYKRYAALKGWNTSDSVVKKKVDWWLAKAIGPVGLAIDFFETGQDNAKASFGHDAEARSANSCIQSITITVAGSEHNNGDGTSRQRVISRLRRGEWLHFVHDPRNSYDSNAIELHRETSGQIGFLPKHQAKEFLERHRNGYLHACIVKEIRNSNRLSITIEMSATSMNIPSRCSNPLEVITTLFVFHKAATNEAWHPYFEKWCEREDLPKDLWVPL